MPRAMRAAHNSMPTTPASSRWTILRIARSFAGSSACSLRAVLSVSSRANTAAWCRNANSQAIPADKLLHMRKRDGPRRLEGARGTQHQRVGELRADEVQPDRQAGLGEAAGNRGRGLAGQVERIGERRPVGPALV